MQITPATAATTATATPQATAPATGTPATSEADFAEEQAKECGSVPKDFPTWIVIDWEATWNCNLRHDYSTATDADGKIWFFHNC